MTWLGSCADNDNKQPGPWHKVVAAHDHKMEKLPTENLMIGIGGTAAVGEGTVDGALYYRSHRILTVT